MTVREIILDWLRAREYNGLVNDDMDCGCRFSNLLPSINCYAHIHNCHGHYNRTVGKLLIDTCAWVEDFEGNWETSCGNMFVLTEGTPSDNEMKYCCYCGKPLLGARYVEEDDGDGE